ncbi:MAG: hypothetical protein DI535_00685 [Citrobacter freundii]|nr:MAG: hypothetical protein DI535_00685 [Citrobacter freundii]
MIKGRVRRFYENGEGDFTEFVRLIENADLTFTRTKDSGEGEEAIYSDEIQFNYSSGAGDYRNYLRQKVDRIKSSLLNEVIFRESRFEKLVYISSKVAELKRASNQLLLSDHGYRHTRFSFVNLSEQEGKDVQLTENDIQDYYQVMRQFTEEAMEHLKVIEHAVEISTNVDFPMLKKAEPDPNEPTHLRPLAFFEYFFAGRGFSVYHINFYPSEPEDYYNISSVDNEAEIIEFVDYDGSTGEPYSYKKEFRQVLFQKVYAEYAKSKKLIDSHIVSLTTEQSVALYLKLVLFQLRHLHNVLQTYTEAKKYETHEQMIKGFIRYILERYEPFVADYRDAPFFKESLAVANNQLTPSAEAPRLLSAPEQVIAFHWTMHSSERTTKLYYALTRHGFIDASLDLIHFSKAFSGEALINPLNISWLKTVKGKLSKPLIIYLFDRLIETKLLEKVQPDALLYKKIQRIFVDHEGKPLQYLEVSSAQVKKRKGSYTKPEEEINVIVAELLR